MKITKNLNNKGSVLVLGLIIVIALGILSMGFLAMMVTESRNSERSNSGLSSMNVAEAGLEYGIWEVIHNGGQFSSAKGWSSLSVPTSRQAFLEDNNNVRIGEYRVNVDNPAGVLTITATGGVPDLTAGSVLQTVQVIVTNEPLFNRGMTGIKGISMTSGVLVDSYDFTQGAYGGANQGSHGDIATDSIVNDAVLIGDAVLVKGDVYVGPGGNPTDVIDYQGSGQITGSENVSSDPTPVPPVQVPTGLPDRGTLNVGFFQTKTISSSGQYDDINVALGGTLNITADAKIYVKDEFNVVLGGTVNVKNGADVDVIVGKKYNVALLSTVNNESQDPVNFAMYGLPTCTNINIIGLCSVYGTFYAPAAQMATGLAVRVLGAATADGIFAGVLAGFHYDESLARRASAPSSGNPQIVRWQTK